MVQQVYPVTVLEVLDAEIIFSDELLCVVRIFAAANPWKGSMETRKRKFCDTNRMLARACHIDTPLLEFDRIDGGSSGPC